MFVKPVMLPDPTDASEKPKMVPARIRDPRRRDYLPAEGREVPDHDSWWLRRLGHGDVVLVLDPPSPAADEPAVKE
jgi:hypothetical protein